MEALSLDKAPAKVVFVLGMHRSGTSAYTRTINLLGADMSADLLKPNDNNPLGFWESKRLVAMHDRLLDAAGSTWDDWTLLDLEQICPTLYEELRAEAVAWLRDNFQGSRLFVVKDPRICRFVPFWVNVLEDFRAAPAAVIPVRNPLEVAASLKARNRFSEQKSHMMWLRHVIDAERTTRDMPRVFTAYEDLVSQPMAVAGDIFNLLRLRRGSASVIAGVDRFLAPELRHHVANDLEVDRCPDVPDWVKQAYEIVTTFTRSGPTPEGLQALEEIGAAFDSACRASAESQALGKSHADHKSLQLLTKLHRRQQVERERRAWRKARKHMPKPVKMALKLTRRLSLR